MSSILYKLLKIIKNSDKQTACRSLTQIEFSVYHLYEQFSGKIRLLHPLRKKQKCN